VYLEDIPTFRKNISPPYLRSKSNPSKKPAEAGGKLSLVNYSILKMNATCSSETSDFLLHGVIAHAVALSSQRRVNLKPKREKNKSDKMKDLILFA
jgi:hypothetical protein